MFRTLLSAVAIAALAGCATTEPKNTISSQDPRDLMIAQSAATATAALRELSETTGNSRVVTTKAVTAPAPGDGAQDKQTASYVESPKPHPTPMQPTIASRSGAVAMETLSAAPQQAPVAVAAPAVSGDQGTVYLSSSGVVASGGLLSVPPAGLEKLITVRWTGELEQLLLQVSREVGWTVTTPTGFRVVPVIISIQAENRSAFDVLRDIGAIAGTSADIRVSTASRTISVNYPKR
jgi:hypothetical protein